MTNNNQVDQEKILQRLSVLESEVSELKKLVNDPSWVKSRFAALGGKSTSEAKRRASRENGKKGWPLPQK